MMDEKPLDQTNVPEENEPEILVNEYGETRDPAVVVDEANRTVLLTDDETIVIDKEPRIDIVPANRPRKVYGGMWGQAELITVAFAMVALFIVAMLYIFMVAPANRELESTLTRRDRLKSELDLARSKYGDITNTETQVVKLMTSVDDFESRYLPVASNGRTSLYQRINGLITGYGLINTSGPDYAPLETIDANDGVQSEEERGRSKYRSLFPGVYVTMTVEGSYQNIRRFIREIETGNDFVVVSAVELEPSDAEAGSDKQNAPAQTAQVADEGFSRPPGLSGNPAITQQPAPSTRNKGKTHGEVVSLRLEMAAYFRRPNVVPQVPATTEQ
jgi:Tfp pilus assembly protein PilO